MANYDQNITINLDVDPSGVQSGLATAAAEIGAIEESIDGLDSDLDDTAEGLETLGKTAAGASDNIEGIGDELGRFRELADAKDEVSESNELLKQMNEEASETADGEAESFDSLIDSASSLQDAKDAVSDSNRVLDEQNEKTRRSILEEKFAAEGLGESFDDVQGAIDSLIGKQDRLSQQEKDSAAAADLETRSFEEMIQSASSLEEAKHAVSNANSRLQNESGKSEDMLLRERAAASDADSDIAKLASTKEDAASSSDRLTQAVRKMRRQTDSTSDSMRAASEMGEIFEDGLGSLSVNMGAFTIALRNFLTQVPLLLTALGAMGSAALGAAAAVGALGSAMIALPAVGLLQHLQSIKSEFDEIESLGEAMQVVMRNLVDTFKIAAEPILDNEQALGFFKDAVQAAAFVVNLLANAFDTLTTGSAALEQQAASVGEEFHTLGELMAMMDGESLEELAGSLMTAFALLGDEAIAVGGDLASGLADGITRASELLARVEDIGPAVSQFGDTISDLSELGFRIGSGLLPVFRTFSEVVESVAASLNRMDGEAVANTITFLALFAAISRVSSMAASFMTIVPNMIVGFQQIAVQASGAGGAIASFRAAIVATSTKVGTFLAQIQAFGGLTALSTQLGATSGRMTEIAFRSDSATRAFQILSASSDQTAEELQELAIDGRLTAAMLEDIAEESDEATAELAQLMAQGELTDEALDDIDADIQGSSVSAEQFLPDMDILGESGEEAGEGFVDRMNGALRGAKGKTAKESDSFFKLFEDSSDAMGPINRKMDAFKDSVGGAGNSLKNAVTPANGFRSAIRGVGESIGGVLSDIGGLVLSMAETAGSAMTSAFAFIFNTEAMEMNRREKIKSIATTIALSVANFALAAAEAVATSSTLALAAALTVATGGVLLLVAAIGGLAVGIITNFEEIKASATDAFGFLKQVMKEIANVFIVLFIESWNTMVDIFQAAMTVLDPIINILMDLGAAFGLVGGDGDKAGSSMSQFSGIMDSVTSAIRITSDALTALFDVLGLVFGMLTRILRVVLMPVIVTIQLLVGVVGYLIEEFLKLFGIEGGFSGLLGTIKGFATGVIDFVQGMVKQLENRINDIIGIFNQFLATVDQAAIGVDVGRMEEVSLTAESGAKTSKGELAKDSDEMLESQEGEGDKNITYQENNQTNVDQTVNADPEDKGTLSRVVKDAMDEANSFQRRRSGFTGN